VSAADTPNVVGDDAGSPVVSIIVCFFDAIEITSRCIDRIHQNTAEQSYELILVDDGSSDPDAGRLDAARPGLRFIRSEQNLGFTGAAILGARHARGEYLVFLNNDTEVEPGWLEALLDAARSGPEVGAVGAMLLSPDRLLQEAGGLIWSDGTGLNYGRGHRPDEPEYLYRREVDYCSGACLMVGRRLFESVGGFDDCFAPGFYEDTDLCFTLRSKGRVVIYEPRARVVHLEGVTFGTADAPGVSQAHSKSGQHMNRLVFLAKWAEELLHQYPSGTAGGLRGGRIPDRPRVLVSDLDLRPPDQSSGGLRMAWVLRILHEIGCEVTYFPFDRIERQPYADWLRRAGVEVYSTGEDFEAMAARRTGLYDLVILSRPSVSAPLRGAVRHHFPQAVLVYDAVDLHFLTDQRHLELKPPGEDFRTVENERLQAKRYEIDEMRASDVVSTITNVERDIVGSLIPDHDVVILPNVHGVRSAPIPGVAGREDLVFIGSYRHLPNVDAVHWFSSMILPLIRHKAPARFFALGSFPPSNVEALASETIVIPGYLNDVSGYFDRARVFVAPLRYGAGMKGKIGMAMAMGLPVVTTSIGAEGMGLVDGINALIADDEEGFASAVLRLYHDDALWESLSVEGVRHVGREWSPDAMKTRLADLMSRTRSRGSMIPRGWGLLDPEGVIG